MKRDYEVDVTSSFSSLITTYIFLSSSLYWFLVLILLVLFIMGFSLQIPSCSLRIPHQFIPSKCHNTCRKLIFVSLGLKREQNLGLCQGNKNLTERSIMKHLDWVEGGRWRLNLNYKMKAVESWSQYWLSKNCKKCVMRLQGVPNLSGMKP